MCPANQKTLGKCRKMKCSIQSIPRTVHRPRVQREITRYCDDLAGLIYGEGWDQRPCMNRSYLHFSDIARKSAIRAPVGLGRRATSDRSARPRDDPSRTLAAMVAIQWKDVTTRCFRKSASPTRCRMSIPSTSRFDHVFPSPSTLISIPIKTFVRCLYTSY